MKYTGYFVNLLAPQRIEFTETALDDRTLGADEIIAETLVSAISPGTELAAYVGKPPLRPGRQYPRLLGYCNVAQIVAVGNAVVGCAVGDRILTGQSHRSIFKIPTKEIILKLPEGIDAAEIAPLYLYELGYLALHSGGYEEGKSVAVIGLGPIGLGVVRLAGISGAIITAVSGDERRLRHAQKMGALTYIKKSAERPRQSDIVITTSNGWDDWHLALELANKGGTIVAVGFPGRGEPLPKFNPLDSEFFYDKRLTIKGMGNVSDEEVVRNCRELLGLVSAEKLYPSEVISGRFPARDIELAYHRLRATGSDAITFLLEWK